MNDPYQQHYNQYPRLNLNHYKQKVLYEIDPIVKYGLKEAQYTSNQHALREIAAISYLMGMGYESRVARQIVESWEINEVF